MWQQNILNEYKIEMLFNVELHVLSYLIPEILDLVVCNTCILTCICVRVCLYSHKCGIFRYISWHLMDLVAQTEENASRAIKCAEMRSSKHAFCVWHGPAETKAEHHPPDHFLYHLLLEVEEFLQCL